MKIGTYYYPDQWSRDDWRRDFDHIQAAGLQLVHIGEFAWGTIEPRENDYQLDWIDEVLTLARERSLDVILCTPTAVLPVWMIDKDPSVLVTGDRFGGRRHGNHLHPLYIDRARSVVDAMARRFGDHPSVIGWQIDNELSGLIDQSDLAHAGFQNWLRKRYETIERLNDAWGCAFWNTFYTDFAQILLPASHDARYRNPHQSLDGLRYWASTYAEFSRMQASVLRPHIGSRWITTNFMPFHPQTDPAEFADHLSLFSWDTYPITGQGSGFKDERFRIADHAAPAFLHDQMRSYNGRWGLMEVQPGQVNWSGHPVKPMPGAVRQLLWQALAHGAEFITVYRWRQPRFGIEMWHDGLVQWDGITPSTGGREFSQVVQELRSLAEASPGISTTRYAPLAFDESVPEVGLLHEHDQVLNTMVLPQAKSWSQAALVTQYHSAIERLALRARVVQSSCDWSTLKLLLIPAFQMTDDALIAKLHDYARAGGHLIISARTAVTDRTNIAPNGLYGHRLFDLIGAELLGYDALPLDTFGEVEFQGRKHRWNTWADRMNPTTAKPLASYVDQFYAGEPAVIQNSVGAGTVTFVGPIDQGSLTDAVVEHVAKQLGMPVVVLPQRTRLHRLRDATVFLNFNPRSVDAPAPTDATFIIGERRVPAAGVAVWR
jgi:beta-galactosidase